MECQICYSTVRPNRKIECPSCQESACVPCIKKYLISNVFDPHCLFCKHPYDEYFLRKNLPYSFINKEYKESRKNLLFEKEKSYFPDYIGIIRQEREREAILDEIGKLEEQIGILSSKYYQVGKSKQKIISIRACPWANCKGFLDSDGKCAVCTRKFCLACNTPSHEDRECNKEDLETWKLIEGSSKACPGCGMRITKNGGCSQMWCPGCHKAFNWNTGAIENGPIHNPHYYEYSARLGVDLNRPRNHCNHEIVWNITAFARIRDGNQEFLRIHRNLNHILHCDFHRIRDKMNQDNQDIGVKFIKNLIDEKDYKDLLLKREKAKMKNERILALYEAIRDSAVLHLMKLLESNITLSMFLEEMKVIQKFSDEMIKDINRTFKSKLSSPIIYS